MELKVFLLSSKEHPELATFFSHLSYDFDYSKSVEELSSKVLTSKVDLLFVENTFLDSPYFKTALQRLFAKLKYTKVYILKDNLEASKWTHQGQFAVDDYQAFKAICADMIAFKETFKAKSRANLTSNSDDEIIVNLDDDDNELETELTRGLVRLKSCTSVDQIAFVLCDTLEKILPEKRKGVFFKYLPTYCSLVAMGSFFFENPKKINGLGLNFSKSVKFKPRQHLQYGLKVPAFTKLCEKLFGHKKLNIRVLSADQDVKGILVYEKPPANSLDIDLETLIDLANTKLEALKYKDLYSKNHIKDNLTSMYIKETFFQNLQNEVIRSKRLFLPVTVFLIEIDNFGAIKNNYNQERVNTLLKNLSHLLESFIRHNDTIGRISENRFGVIFPHMHRVHASKKAESILQRIKETQFFSDIKERFHCTCSISYGVYPNSASSSEELITLLQSSLDKNDKPSQIRELSLLNEDKKDFNELSLSELSDFVLNVSKNRP